VQLRRKRAHALHAVDQAVGLQLFQRAVHGHAADAEQGHQLGFGRHQFAGRPLTGHQSVFQVLLDLGVGRQAVSAQG